MKVLKEGRAQKGWAREYACSGSGNGGGGCGAMLLVEAGDLFRTQRSFCGRDTESFVTFECQQCGVLTDIDNAPMSPQKLPTLREWRLRRGLVEDPEVAP